LKQLQEKERKKELSFTSSSEEVNNGTKNDHKYPHA